MLYFLWRRRHNISERWEEGKKRKKRPFFTSDPAAHLFIGRYLLFHISPPRPFFDLLLLRSCIKSYAFNSKKKTLSVNVLAFLLDPPIYRLFIVFSFVLFVSSSEESFSLVIKRVIVSPSLWLPVPRVSYFACVFLLLTTHIDDLLFKLKSIIYYTNPFLKAVSSLVISLNSSLIRFLEEDRRILATHLRKHRSPFFYAIVFGKK